MSRSYINEVSPTLGGLTGGAGTFSFDDPPPFALLIPEGKFCACYELERYAIMDDRREVHQFIKMNLPESNFAPDLKHCSTETTMLCCPYYGK